MTATTGFSFTAISGIEVLFGAVFGVLAYRIAREDARAMIVHDNELVLLLAGGLLFIAFEFSTRSPAISWGEMGAQIVQVLSRIILLGGTTYLLGFAYRIIRGREGLGFGDVKLVAVAGAWLTLDAAILAITLAALAALLLLPCWALVQRRPVTATTAVPFAAFLAPAFWLVWAVHAGRS